MKKSTKSKVLCYILVFAMLPIFSMSVMATEDYVSLIMDEGIVVDDYDSIIMDEITAGVEYDEASMALVDEVLQDIAVAAAGTTISIRNEADLTAMVGGESSEGLIYVLENNIQLTQEWVPIMDFRGTFDGQGHTIHNLFVLGSSNHSFAGLFGSTNNATIRNVMVHIGAQGVDASSSTSGNVNAGGLIGNAGYTNIHNVHVIGNVSANLDRIEGNTWAGGLVGVWHQVLSGENHNVIERSSFIGNVSASAPRGFRNKNAGGLVGIMTARYGSSLVISDSYTRGRVTAVATHAAFRRMVSAAGIVGYDSSLNGLRVVENSYSTSEILTGVLDWAPYVPANYPIGFSVFRDNLAFGFGWPRVNNSFFLEPGISGSRGIALTPEEMRRQSSFTGWDFENIWEFRSGENDDFPILRSQTEVGELPPPDEDDFSFLFEPVARFIVENGELLYDYWLRPQIQGRRDPTFRVYRFVNERVISVGNDNFSTIRQNMNTDYLLRFCPLERTVSLVLDEETLQKMGFLHHMNASWSRPLSFVETSHQVALDGERAYHETLRRFDLADTGLEILSTQLGGAIALKTGSSVNFLASFAANQIPSPNIPRNTTTVRTQHYLRASSRSALDSLNSHVTGLYEGLNASDGRIRDYQTAVDFEEFSHLFTKRNEFFRMDLKYMRQDIQRRFWGGFFDVFLSFVELTNSFMFNIDVIDEWIEVYSVASDVSGVWISTNLPTNNDSCLQRMKHEIRESARGTRQRINFPRADRWGNLALHSPPRQRSIALPQLSSPLHQNFRDLTVVAFAPSDVTVYNQLQNTPIQLSRMDQVVALFGSLDVAVFCPSGELLGTITDSVVEYRSNFNADEHLLILAAEDRLNVLTFPNENNYRIEITSTSMGLMRYLEFRIDEQDNVISDTISQGFFLQNGQILTVNPSEREDVDYTRLFAGNEVLSVVIHATVADDNGKVVAVNNGYLIGDTVHLTAIPNESYQFEGWYERGARLPDAGAFYSFVAEVDRTLEARFVRAVPSDPSIPSEPADPAEPSVPSIPNWPSRPNFGTQPAQPPTAPPPTPTSTPTPQPNETEVSVAEALFRLGLFVGTGADADGNPVFEPNRPPTRLEALALVIRLMGLQNEAMAYTGNNRFTDVPAWGNHYATFGYNIGITVGVNEERTLFAPNRQVTAHEFSTFLLRVLGYNEADGDFVFEEAMQKASIIGFFSPFGITRISTDNFLRDHAVHAMANALLTPPKGSNEYLLYRLAGQGVFSREDADWFIQNVR